MSESIDIRASEREVIRVFSLDLDEAEIEDFVTRDADGHWPLRAALHAERLDPDRVEVFPVSDLSGIGLSGYLIDGLGIDERDVAEMRGVVDSLKGHVMILGSPAFCGIAQRILPEPPISLVATFRERPALRAVEPLRSDAAEGPPIPTASGPAAGAPGPGRRGLLLTLLAAAGALALLLAFFSGGQP